MRTDLGVGLILSVDHIAVAGIADGQTVRVTRLVIPRTGTVLVVAFFAHGVPMVMQVHPHSYVGVAQAALTCIPNG